MSTSASMQAAARTMTAGTLSANVGVFPQLSDSPYSDSPAPPAPGSRDTIKWLPEGAQVLISNGVVSAAFGDHFYVEKSDRTFGIRVDSPDYVWPGELVDVTGVMGTDGGERCVVASSGNVAEVDYTYTYPIPIPLGMANKQLGGGPVGSFTPAVADMVGVNNTGLLARAWGRVTATSYDNNYYCNVFYIDDGSNLQSDLTDPTNPSGTRYTGLKVYDTTGDLLPDENSYQTVNGVSSAEIPQGLASIIRTLWKVEPASSDIQVGTSGTISGTITATGADGQTIRVYCASASTTATFSGSTANYTLHVPYGTHAVTASMLGYKTTAQYAVVSSATPVDVDFTLATLERVIDIVSTPSRVPPDGTSQITITAIVRDEEGRRFADEPVTWGNDIGTPVSSDATTNAVGEASMVLQAATTSGTATVSVTSGSAAAECFEQFATANAPSIWITGPATGTTVSGKVDIIPQYADNSGSSSSPALLVVYIDGTQFAAYSPSNGDIWWNSCDLPNGSHQITATVTDQNGNTMNSNVVSVISQNSISAFAVAPTDVAPNQSVHISGQAIAGGWTVNVTDSSNDVVWSTSGTGTAISADWPGTSQGDLYSVTATATADGSSTNKVSAVNTTQSPQFLIVAADESLPWFETVHQSLVAICKRRNITYKVLTPKDATWANISAALSQPVCKYFYIMCHGEAQHVAPPTTFLSLPAAMDVLYARRQSGWPADGELDTIQRPPTLNRVRYATSLNRANTPLKFVWIDACYSGFIGAERPLHGHTDGDAYWGDYGLYSCYETVSMNDLASAFGITSYAGGYVGWFGESAPGDPRYVGGTTPPNAFAGITVDAFGTLVPGTTGSQTFEFTRQWIQDHRLTYRTPKPDEPSSRGPLIAPFFNWRFFGNSAGKYF